MYNKTILFFLLIFYSVSSSAQETPTSIEDTKTQAALASDNTETGTDPSAKKEPTGRELVEQEQELQRLAAEIDRKRALYAKGPKRKFISASTQAYEYRPYMAAFVKKLEEFGNADYPETFIKKHINARVVVTVAIRRDGSVENAVITTSSKIPEVDAFVLTTVDKAQPFAPLPEAEQKIDVLHITRTWDFSSGDLETF